MDSLKENNINNNDNAEALYKQMTNSSSQILRKIEQLQQIEDRLYSQIDGLDDQSTQKQTIIDQIEDLVAQRMQLYENLQYIYDYYSQQDKIIDTVTKHETDAIWILENQMNEKKRQLNAFQLKNKNQLRLIEINTYYGKRYGAYANIMKTIVLLCIPIVFLIVLYNNNLLPSRVYALLMIICMLWGIFSIGFQMVDILSRSHMNWDEYNWSFDKKKAPIYKPDLNIDNQFDPWATPTMTCVGSACCSGTDVYNKVTNKCVGIGTNN